MNAKNKIKIKKGKGIKKTEKKSKKTKKKNII
jgi:hypothetical protein